MTSRFDFKAYSAILFSFLLLCSLSTGLWAQMTEKAEKPAQPTSAPPPSKPPAPTTTPYTPIVQTPEDTCAGGVVVDDGTVESGCGFIRSLDWGTFVQRFDSERLAGKKVDRVCVCFLSSRGVSELDFEVVFHKEVGGRPADEPYARVKSHAADLPPSVKDAGRFYPVDIEGVELPDGPSYIGVRWDPGEGHRAFLCTSKGTKGNVKDPVLGFQRDNLSKAWENVLTTKDSIFFYHQNALIRVVPETPAGEGTAGKEGPSSTD